MKKFTFLFIAMLTFCWQSNAQFSFPAQGPVTTLDGVTPVIVPLNDVANAAGVPAGSYVTFTVTCDWVNLDNAWSEEERLSVVTAAGASTPIAPSNGLGTTASVNGLTFSGSFGPYDPSTDGLLELSLTRTFNSDAQLSNIVVTIVEAPPCPNPSGLTIDSFNASSATISWTAGGSEPSWEIAVQPDGTGIPASGTSTASNPYFQLGLSGSTAYEVYLRANCDGAGDFGPWIGPVDFTTLPSAPPACPASFTATPDASCGNFDTTISWDPVVADGYRITVGTTMGGNEIADNVDVGNNTSTIVGNQTPGTTYYYTVAPYNVAGTQTGCTEQTYTTFATGCLCASVPSSNDGNGISNVRLDVTDFPTGDVTYFDHSGTVIDLAQGIIANCDITFETGPTYDTNIWIDFNDDLVLDGSELVYSGTSAAANPTTLNADFTVPAMAALGQHKMRIATADFNQATPDPCYNGTWGVTLDFDVNIVATACTPATLGIDGVTVVDDCVAGTYNVVVDIDDPGTATFIVGLAPVPITAGDNIVGPFTIGTTSPPITIVDITDSACNINLGTFSSDGNPPTDFAASNVTATSVDLSWTSNGAETSWEVAVVPDGDPEPTGSGTDTMGANPYTVSGLSAETAYDAYVRAVCGDTEWVGPLSFTTPCNVFTPDYTEDFTTFLDGCWQEANGGDLTAGPLNFGTGGFGSEEFAHGSTTGGGAVNINLFLGGPDIDWLLTPTFDLSAGGYQLEVDVALTNYNSTAQGAFSPTDDVRIVYSNDGTNWTDLAVYNSGNTPAAAGQTEIIDLTGITGTTVQFAFYVSEGTDNGRDIDFHIDNFKVRVPPTCGDVSGISVSSVDDSSASISWTDAEGETNWEIAVQTAGTGIPGTANDSGTDTTNNPYSATGLTAATQYEVFVRADCSGDGSNLGSWIGPVNFTTLPPAPNGVTCALGGSTFIFTEEFAAQGDWTGNINGGDGTWEIPGDSGSGGTGPSSEFSGAAGSFMNYEASGGTTSTASAVSPAIDLSSAVDGAELSFYMHAYGAGMGTLNVGVGTSVGGPFTTEFTWSGPLQTATTDAWTPIGVDLSAYLGTVIYIEFSHTGINDFEGDMSIDYVRVESCGDFCVDPSDIVVSNINGSEADIAWTSNGTESAWEVVVQPQGTGLPAGPGTPTASNPYTESGLSELTAYEVYVRADCGSSTFSGWAGPVNFTTTEACPTVTGISLDSVDATSAQISWTSGGGVNETGFEIVVQPDGTGAPAGAGTPATNPYTASGLSAETAYEVYVRANCDTDGFSTWAGPLDFTTPCAAIVPDYLANMSVNVPDSCWDEAGAGEVVDGPSGLGASDWTNGTYAAGGSNRINLFAASDREWLLSPGFDLSADGYELVVNVAVTDWNNGFAADTMGSDDEVQLLMSTDNGASWTTLTTWNAGNQPATGGTEYTEDLTGVTGSFVRFAIWASDGTVNDLEDYDFHIGRFEVRTPPSCSEVSGISVTNIGTTTADIAWTAGDGGDSLWEVAIQAPGTGEPALTDNSGTDTGSNPYSATGLTENTAYEVYVRTDCSGDFGSWIGPVNFSTSCSPFAVPFNETFDSTSATESCWTVLNVNGDADAWDTNYTLDVISGDESAALNTDFNGGNNDDWLITPTITLTGNERLVFRYSLQSTFEPNDFEVLLSTSGTAPAAFTNVVLPLASYNDVDVDLGQSTELTVDLSAFAGDVNIAWHVPSGGLDGWRLYIDDVVVEEIPACPDISGINVSNISTTSADISWILGGTETDWEIAVQAPGTGEPAAADGSGTDTSSNPYTASGLTAQTDYEVYVRSDCGGGDLGNWIGPVNFSTACNAFSLPIVEGFESGVPPQCWSSFRGTNGEGTGFDWTTSTAANSGTTAAFVRYENVANEAQDWLVTPAMDFTGVTNAELTFFAAQQFGLDYGTEYTIRVSTTDTNIASFTTVQTYTEADFPVQGTDGYDQFVVDLTAYNGSPTVYVAFVMTNDDGDNFFLDDVLIWDNAPGTYTYNDGVWSPFTPGNDLDDIIVASGNLPIGSDFTCNTMTVNPGAAVTVVTGNTLEATNGLFLQSSSTSYSSLIRNGSIVGPIEYERHVNINGSGTTGSNDLISAPLTGQQFNDFAAANPNIFSNGAGTLYLFGPFRKSDGTFLTWSNTETATLDPGVGYRAASNDNGSFTFVGTDNTTDVAIDIQNTGPNNAEWNLVGNPYPSYLNVQDFLLHDVGGVVNIQLFDAPTAAIYGYDGSALNGWTIYNLATTSASTVITPGQGFFVSADATNAGLYDLEFTPSMRDVGTSDDFIVGRTTQLTYLKLALTSNSNAFNTDFYFNANASEGFDVGYDAAIWGETAPAFSIYSRLVEGDAGEDLALQALKDTDITNTTIPLGVNANQGEQITFSIHESTLPANVKVYLDDTVKNTSTLLNTSDYVLTPATDLSGTGRFFLRYEQDELSTIDGDINVLDIYTLKDSNELVVSGQLADKATLDLFDIQGRRVLTMELDSALLQNRIDVTNINAGIYLATVTNNNQETTKKVIIE